MADQRTGTGHSIDETPRVVAAGSNHQTDETATSPPPPAEQSEAADDQAETVAPHLFPRRSRLLVDTRVIVCGSRRWHDRELIAHVLSELQIERGWTPLIVHGATRGADRIADEEAGKLGFLTEPHPADWERHGKAAGPIRNEEMAQAGAALCIVFWDGKVSHSGTMDMVRRAYQHGIPSEVHCGKPNGLSLVDIVDDLYEQGDTLAVQMMVTALDATERALARPSRLDRIHLVREDGLEQRRLK